MKSNEAIFREILGDDFSQDDTHYSKKFCIEAMKEAQVEALRELTMRENLWLMGTDDRSKSIYVAINNAISQLIKEIES